MICVVPGYIHTAFTEGYIWKFQGARKAVLGHAVT